MTSWVLKPGSHGTPPDDVGLDEGPSRRERTGLWGWLWGRGDFPLRRGVMFISIIQLTVGLCCRGVRGVYGAVERRHAAPAVVGRLSLILDTELGFWVLFCRTRRTDDNGRNRAPPRPPFFEQKIAKFLSPIFNGDFN